MEMTNRSCSRSPPAVRLPHYSLWKSNLSSGSHWWYDACISTARLELDGLPSPQWLERHPCWWDGKPSILLHVFHPLTFSRVSAKHSKLSPSWRISNTIVILLVHILSSFPNQRSKIGLANSPDGRLISISLLLPVRRTNEPKSSRAGSFHKTLKSVSLPTKCASLRNPYSRSSHLSTLSSTRLTASKTWILYFHKLSAHSRVEEGCSSLEHHYKTTWRNCLHCWISYVQKFSLTTKTLTISCTRTRQERTRKRRKVRRLSRPCTRSFVRSCWGA